MGWFGGLVVAVLLAGAPELKASYESPQCEKKRVDACGCHHVYGIRHCHPNRKTSRCEATASGKAKLETPQVQKTSL